MNDVDVLVVGAGASGLFCALTAGQQGRQVTIIDHANKVGKKILMSGGGKCNFTNYDVSAAHFISDNPHFCKSALSRYPSWSFIELVERHHIEYVSRKHDQLYCKESSRDILDMLLAECQSAQVTIQTHTSIIDITPLGDGSGFRVKTERDHNIVSYRCASLVIATGGLSIPTMGATGFGYEIATQFGHDIIPTQAALVPFIFTDAIKEMTASLSGSALDVKVTCEEQTFTDPMLFTHRGLSGPAILQISSYWQAGATVYINLLPHLEATAYLLQQKTDYPNRLISTVLSDYFSKKMLTVFAEQFWQSLTTTPLANISDAQLIQIGQTLNQWALKPAGTEGYRTAEVTRGGVATTHISSKTFESQRQPRLYFIGEVLDVTGWLGGYNFQWAWASGYCAGLVV